MWLQALSNKLCWFKNQKKCDIVAFFMFLQVLALFIPHPLKKAVKQLCDTELSILITCLKVLQCWKTDVCCALLLINRNLNLKKFAKLANCTTFHKFFYKLNL